ncbi:MAG: sugar ABC transporter ATP-binding protein, partial [Verrucomicrobia bacterium]|nr:sugar ABC transporter ATP-binding protein [Verrucomicrobiota bacterium]
MENDSPTPGTAPSPFLELSRVTKRFPGVVALDSVDVIVRKGEIHALVGENGAGKSTLIKLLCGTYVPDSGLMYLGGMLYRPQSPLDGLKAGIRVVYQEFSLLPFLSVAENLLFDHLPSRYRILLDRKNLQERTTSLLAQVGLDVDPWTRVEQLGVAQNQLLEIAKALSTAGRLLILDEPTATLTTTEISRLFEIVRNVRDTGVTIIYVSHHLNEIFQLCDTVTVLRNGSRVATKAVSKTNSAEVVHLMVGHELESVRATHSTVARKFDETPALRVQGLRYRGNTHGIDLDLHYGELVGLAGLVGSGRTETLRATFGADQRDAGRIYRDGRSVALRNPSEAVKNGVCLLTENRKEEGLVLPMAVRVNITLTDLAQVSRAGFLDRTAERALGQRWVKEIDLRIASLEQATLDLSGGNQQKVVLAKWLLRNAAVLMLDEPTRGIDVGAKAEIHELLRRLAARKKAILVVSSEIPELVSLCDRIVVLSRGRVAGEVLRDAFSEERILSLAASVS